MFRYGPVMELGYAWVSTTKQDLDRQVDALTSIGIESAHIFYVTGEGAPTADRPARMHDVGPLAWIEQLDRLDLAPYA
jgi:hypothetical protein